LSFHMMNTWGILSLAVVYGVISAVFLPSSFAIVPSLVESSMLQQANGLLQLANQGSMFVGPALTGIIITKFGLASTYVSMSVATMISFVLLLSLKNQPSQLQPHQVGETQQRQRGKYTDIIRIPLIPFLILLSAILNLGVVGPMQVGLPTVAHETQSLGAQGLGYLTASFGLGSMFGAVFAGWIRDKRKKLAIMFLAGTCLGCVWSIVGFQWHEYILVVVLGITGLCVGVVNVLFITVLQTQTPLHILGRVMALQLFGSIGLQPVSLLLSGWVVSFTGIRTLFLCGGAMVASSCMFGAVLVKIASSRSKRKTEDTWPVQPDVSVLLQFRRAAAELCKLIECDNSVMSPESLRRIAFLLAHLYSKMLELPTVESPEGHDPFVQNLAASAESENKWRQADLSNPKEQPQSDLERNLIEIYHELKPYISKLDTQIDQSDQSVLKITWHLKRHFWLYLGPRAVDALRSIHVTLSSVEMPIYSELNKSYHKSTVPLNDE
jgi:MFS family permease